MKYAMGFSALLAAGLTMVAISAPAVVATTQNTKPESVTLDGVLNPRFNDTPAFTPDGKTVFFDRSAGSHKTIMVSHKVGGHWSTPEVASFSGHWFDQDPVVAPDGSYLLFDSDRPTRAGGKPLMQRYFNNHKPAPGSNIWKVKRNGDGWGKPIWLGPAVNRGVFVDFPSVAADGTLYFIRWSKQARVMHTWCSRYRDGKYLPPTRAGLGNPAVSTHDPAIAPDQSFIVFDYGRLKGGLGRLSIAYREGDHWSKPISLGGATNKLAPWGSRLAPGAHTVYFTGNAGIYKLSLAPWLRQHERKDAAIR